MMIRVYKKSDGLAIYDFLTETFAERPEDCPSPSNLGLDGLPFILVKSNEIPLPIAKLGSSNLYFDGECKKENLKQDTEWKVCLMPTFLIKKKHLARCNTQLDEELAKDSPDPIKVAKLQRDKEKCATWTEKQWYEQAKTNIINENIDKPVILEKLNQKIEEIP